ncbi:MAG: hypothetical protein LBC39_04995 [Methanobrevibacter sp.]|jgi:hypothetical protein|nr:hypothetical protein [Candidatus Methanovirga aequatorialis]
MKRVLAIGLLLLIVASSFGAVSADKGNLNDYVNVGKWNTGYNYNYQVYFYDAEMKQLNTGNSEEKGCYWDQHVKIPDNAAYYKVSIDAHMAGSNGGHTEFIPAKYTSNGVTHKNTGIFTIKGGICTAYCDYALETDVGRVINSWRKADGESGRFSVYGGNGNL